MKKLLLLALVIGVAGCAHEGGSAKSDKGAPQTTKSAAVGSPLAGYTQSGKTVTFVFDPSAVKGYTDGSTNELVTGKAVDIKTVNIAGAFNEWSSDANPLEQKGKVWTTTLDTEKLGAGEVPFKFVINGQYWAEPGPSAPNAVDNGMGNDGKNLIYTGK